MVNSGEFWGVELGKWVKGDFAVSLTSIWDVWVFVGAVSEESKQCGGGRHPGSPLGIRRCLLVLSQKYTLWVRLLE